MEWNANKIERVDGLKALLGSTGNLVRIENHQKRHPKILCDGLAFREKFPGVGIFPY